MPKIKPRILVIDDEDSMLKTYRAILKNFYDLVLVNNGEEAIARVRDEKFSAALLDINMPKMNGLEVLRRIKEIDDDLEVIMITAVQDVKSAVQAIRLEAYDYISKPFEMDDLLAVIKRALERKSLVRENIYLRQLIEEKGIYMDMVGKSQAMKKIFVLIDKVAGTDTNVLIRGESGTGKELVAHAIHRKSTRASQPFVVINCAALPETLIESELFGHERGAFTGAMERKQGKFELADGGTIFLDEIGCMKPSLQSKLLRFLQDSRIERVGGAKPFQINVRVIAATNLDLKEAIKKGDFREDLYYRLNIIDVDLSPLRERKEDIPLLLDYFMEKYCKELNKPVKGFSKEALKLLKEYVWPGNIRELQNLVERVVALYGDEEYISPDDLSIDRVLPTAAKKKLKQAQCDFEKDYIKNALRAVGGNQTKAAKLLGINRTTLIAKVKRLKVDPQLNLPQ